MPLHPQAFDIPQMDSHGTPDTRIASSGTQNHTGRASLESNPKETCYYREIERAFWQCCICVWIEAHTLAHTYFPMEGGQQQGPPIRPVRIIKGNLQVMHFLAHGKHALTLPQKGSVGFFPTNQTSPTS